MIQSSTIESGRAAATELRWAEAYERLSIADADGGLAPPDLEVLATAALLRGEGHAALDVMTRAHEAYVVHGDVESGARAAAWIAVYQIELGEFSHSFEWIPRARRLLTSLAEPSTSVVGLAMVPTTVASIASGDHLGAERQAIEIEEIAERFRDLDLAAMGAFLRGYCVLELGDDGAGFAHMDRAVAAVEHRATSPVFSGFILCTAVGMAHIGFDLARVVAWTAVLDDWCRGQPELVAYDGQRHALRSALLRLQGAWDEASTEAELGMSRFRAGDYRAMWGAPYWYGELQRLRGALHSAAESFRRAGEAAWDPHPGAAMLLLTEGKVERAQEQIRRSAADADRFMRRYRLPAMVEIEIAAGDLEASRRALAELRVRAGSTPSPMLATVIAFATAQVRLAEGDAAEALVAGGEAGSGWRELGVPYELARSRVLLGRALRALGEAERARAEFEAARAGFTELGAVPALVELDRIMGSGRGSGALTDRELEVLRLVSTGLTNRAIAERLSLSEKTVARHLSNIFAKLGLSSRAGATAYAYENGLV
ncbi:DNA-binding CsgD family transcriptional regulator [Agromyces flavus]|uniref:DNA-binding CsgD family transcriptional regulator n=1 Tax=Agromyces flavus TaxID=589382 RepID=A0A1H1XC43_9MICO|nr:helix-turn-helix transcriptional regulator [Agromyces flavus]MCP2366382.1 DNA-binding CsgD family transcriptional regulator [Agromyces flavus]GGI44564.1 helix-turn-helix transcriptional regulator [Agromyces flavus]SDT06884.1 regulatory protein, luxR family [Agromyces flavus]